MGSKKEKKDRKRKREKEKKKKKKLYRKQSDSSDSESSDSDNSKSSKSSSSSFKRSRESTQNNKIEQIAQVLGYSNDINPFGDSNLLKPFSWGKKKEQEKEEKKSGSSKGKDKANEDEKRIKLLEDIEKARKRREDRENEVEEMERLRAEEQRLRDVALYGDWQSKEEEFHLEQTKIRSKIRLVNNRFEPIDMIAKGLLVIEAINSLEDKMYSLDKNEDVDRDLINNLNEIDLIHPLQVVENLSLGELEKLYDDCNNYLILEMKSNGKFTALWENLKSIVTFERKSKVNAAENNINKNIKEEIKTLIKNKNLNGLNELRNEIESKMKNNELVDVSYWEILSEEINNEISKLLVSDIHNELIIKRNELLKSINVSIKSKSNDATNKNKSDSNAEIENSLLAIDDDLIRKLDESEERMKNDDEVAVASSYKWIDKYSPRKPRYFNRIRTGWEWNKYNQTHYDGDNAPPKTVQGYKFTIFYPDLIDKTKTPKYFIERCPDDAFVIIRFHGGPPYEDIAFRIVNKEWDTNRFAGFRCMFDRGVLQLHFNFKRHFYRR